MDENTPFRILCCTDFSDNALAAFRHAVEQASRHPGEQLYLLHVVPEPDSQFWKTYIYQADFDIDDQAKRDIDARVNADYRPLVPAGITLIPSYRIGRDYEKILDFSREINADLLVVGRQGRSRSPLRAFFFGNVAERVAAQAACPVLIVPQQQ